MSEEIKLGQKVKDKVTGFIGIAISKVEYLNGCVQFCVKPKVDKDGKCLDGEWFDVDQLTVVSDGVFVKKKVTGGPQTDTPKSSYGGYHARK